MGITLNNKTKNQMGGHHTSTNAGKNTSTFEHSTTDQSTTYNNQWGENNIRGGNVGAGAVIGLQNLALSEIPSYASLHPSTQTTHTTYTAPTTHQTTAPATSASSSQHA